MGVRVPLDRGPVFTVCSRSSDRLRIQETLPFFSLGLPCFWVPVFGDAVLWGVRPERYHEM